MNNEKLKNTIHGAYGGFPRDYRLPEYHIMEDEDDKKEDECEHEWKKVRLIVSTVEVCEKCGVKKEDK